MKVIFFGTPAFASEILNHLLFHHVPIAAVVTQPDRPKGRSAALNPSPVKLVAEQAGIPILQPEKSSQETFLHELVQFQADLYVVVAFGQILPQKLLDLPPLGCINVHASLLPSYRGAAPMQRCLMDGVTETGVCVQKMVRQLDAGDVIAEAKISVPVERTFGELQKELCDLSKSLLLSVIHQYEKGIPDAKPQDSSLVTMAPKIETEECEIDWTWPAEEIHNKVRALSPRPGAWCWIEIDGEKKRLKVLRTKIIPKTGSVKQFSLKEGLIFCGQEAIQLIEIQLEGKKAMPAADWLRGLKSSPQLT
ncbi:MAG: methionyl-tRNA formyltransferase [Verrucomicrobia bacterium]|nr:methionyl-tRNA formyltransferase [Verrucomicrobiota bacterium]